MIERESQGSRRLLILLYTFRSQATPPVAVLSSVTTATPSYSYLILGFTYP